MKKMYSLFLVMLFTTNCTEAQIRTGLKTGINLSSLKGSGYTDPDQKSFMGLAIGGLANYKIDQNFSIQPEVLFSREGTQWKSLDYDQKNRLSYLNIPVLLQYDHSGFFAHTGPQIGLLVSAKMKYKENRSPAVVVAGADPDRDNPDGSGMQKSDIKNYYAYSPVSWALGAGYIHESGFGINARYNIGLSNTFKKTNVTNIHSRVFSIGVIYMLCSTKKKVQKPEN